MPTNERELTLGNHAKETISAVSRDLMGVGRVFWPRTVGRGLHGVNSRLRLRQGLRVGSNESPCYKQWDFPFDMEEQVRSFVTFLDNDSAAWPHQDFPVGFHELPGARHPGIIIDFAHLVAIGEPKELRLPPKLLAAPGQGFKPVAPTRTIALGRPVSFKGQDADEFNLPAIAN